MVIKRKRSESELSFNSCFSSPPRPGSSAFDFGAMGSSNWSALSSRPTTPSHLHSRTFKRFRDNRPTEAEVHQRTLNLLFSAQHQPPNPCEAEHEVDTVMTTPTLPEAHGRRGVQQRSLHSFWRLPVTAPSSAHVLPSPPIVIESAAMNCEDCATGLGDDNDTTMDIDGLGSEGHSCGACGKMVCFSCSISNLGESRRCLGCAQRSELVRVKSVGMSHGLAGVRRHNKRNERNERKMNGEGYWLGMVPELSGYPLEDLVCLII
ncbi:hypothetical protein B0T16DRAFT_427825 [Cercophora newfieldiana]|uniref:Uncharacterized protein n=1 Tax=Cercophora newfieldiana TaxID=92897 RepID=A0AA40CTL7_9PEZI|nr:hypothetical protein B0T16DRAFT_427825 [Cercophora newfieldiana]